MSAITPQLIFSAFDEAEQNLPVATWEIGGLKVWPLIRNYHAYWLCTQKAFDRKNEIAESGSQTGSRLRQIAKTCLEHARNVLNDSGKNDVLRPTDVLIAAHSSTRYFQVEGAWYNPYSDSIAKHLGDLGLDSLVLEFTGDGKYLTPRFAKSIFVQARSFLISIQAKIAAKTGYPALEEALVGWEAFVLLLDARLGEGCRPDLDSMRFRARQVLGYEVWAAAIIRRARPKVGIVTGYYSTDMMGFIRAFRKAGLLSVEIQHGVQGAQHFAYRKWDKLPAGGYDTMPEVFWSWSETERNYINSWAEASGGAHRAVIGGNPCLHIYDQKGSTYLHKVSAPATTDQNEGIEMNVLFTAQAFSELPASVLDLIRRTPRWKWWVRTHPQYVEAARAIRKVCSEFANAVVDEADELPLAVLLNHCDVHVTEFSSSVLEAKSKGVRSVVVNPIGIELFRDLVESGEVVFASSTPELLDSIVQQAEKRQAVGAASAAYGCFFSDVMSEILQVTQEQDSRASLDG